MIRKIALALFICLSLSACGGSPSDDTTSETAAPSTSSSAASAQRTDLPSNGDPSDFDADTVASQIDVVEYTYTGHTRYYTVLVLKNNSEFNIDLTIDMTSKDPDGDIIGAQSKSLDVFESGTETVVKFYDDSEVASIEYTLTPSLETYYISAVSQLSSEVSISGYEAIVSITNNGEHTASYVYGTALFFHGETLVYSDYDYIGDDDSEIKPGETVSGEIHSTEYFDSVIIYVDGKIYL